MWGINWYLPWTQMIFLDALASLGLGTVNIKFVGHSFNFLKLVKKSGPFQFFRTFLKVCSLSLSALISVS